VIATVAWSALASMLFGGGDFLGGLGARRAPALLVTLLAMLVGFAVLVPAAMRVAGAPIATDFYWSGAGGVLGGLGVALLFRVLAAGPVGTVSPIVAVTGCAMPVIAGLSSGERPELAALFGIAAAVVAIVLVSGGPSGGHARARTSTLALAAVSGVGLGGFLVCIARVAEAAGLWPLVVARAAGTASVVALLLGRREPIRFGRGTLAICAASGLLDSVANLLYFWIVKQGALSIVGTIVSLSPATVILLARLVLHERFHRRQIAGLALAALAIVLMTAGKS
jgi:drug/metabolite transporter (DMT)-like permease